MFDRQRGDDPIVLLFETLRAFYGASRMERAFGDVDVSVLIPTWRVQLDGVRREAIEYALRNLPASFPPTAGEFRALCLQYRGNEAPALPHRPLSRKEQAQRARALREAMGAVRGRPGKDWAHRILERARTERLPVAVVEMARKALRGGDDDVLSE